MKDFATTDDVITLFRSLTKEEVERTNALLPIISDSLRMEARKYNVNLDEKLKNDIAFSNVLKSVTVDIVARTLMTSTNQEPMTQTSESALGYSFSGTFLNPGGGLFIKRSELSRLGLTKQRYGVIDFYGEN